MSLGVLWRNVCVFPCWSLKKCAELLGDRLLLYRLGSDDLAPIGTHIEDSVVFAKRLEALGVDILDVSGGMCGSEPRQLRQIKGYFVPQAQAIKKAVNVPVIGVGGITEAEFADKLVREGKVDLVAVGRAFWTDNQWAENAYRNAQKLQNSPTNYNNKTLMLKNTLLILKRG